VIWLTWRQFRTQAAVVFGVLGVAVVLAVTGPISSASTTPTRCTHTATQGSFTNRPPPPDRAADAAPPRPALIGIFWGAPLIARELETGTYRLGWTQSITRRRWLAVKLGVVGLARWRSPGS
jgi:hypothetical protein